jgi:pimeloyl-ACP methyl ester carboxylesterase
MAQAVRGVAAFLDELGLDRPHVAGNSLGGAFALELAAAGLVASATALSPAGFCTRRELRWAIGVLTAHRVAARLPEPVLRAMFRSGPLRAMSFGMLFAKPRRLTPQAALADALALRDALAFRAVARAGPGYAFSGAPTVPVTVAWGTRDWILPYRQAAIARRVLPNARHVDLPGCGHVPMSDNPDLIASVIHKTVVEASPKYL